MSYPLTSESVTEGHHGKICAQGLMFGFACQESLASL